MEILGEAAWPNCLPQSRNTHPDTCDTSGKIVRPSRNTAVDRNTALALRRPAIFCIFEYSQILFELIFF